MNVVVKLPRPEPGLARRRPATRPVRRRRAAWVAASALLHLLLLAALLAPDRTRPPPQEGGAPSVEMVFDTTPAPPAAAPQQEDAPTPGQNEVTPTAPPDETATQPGEEAAAPKPAPAPAPEPPAPPPQPVAPPEPAPAPTPKAAPPPEPAPAEQAPPQPAAPPAVRLEDPDALPLPSRPIPIPEAPPMPPRPAPQARPRPAPNPFAGTLMLEDSLGFQRPPGRPAPRSGAPSRAIDLSIGPVSPEPTVSGRYAAARAANAAQDWNGLFKAWFNAHKYYPRDAAQRGEDGTATVQITVDRYGHVQVVELIATSGSSRLDAALLGMLRGADIPPLLHGMPMPFTYTVALHYILIR